MTDSEFVAKEPCPACGSRDNLARYSDGHAHCFGCGHYEHGDGQQPQQQRSRMSGDLLPFGEARAITSRGLTEETCQKWGYTVLSEGVRSFSNDAVQVAHYRDDKGQIVGQKVRSKNKDFTVRGSISGHLYGRWLWRDAGRRVIITEGEIDALTVSQVLDHKWPVVSLPNGAQGARKSLAENLQWLNRFDQVILCFDQDDPGREATEACCSLFPPGKLRIVTLPLKDASAMFTEGRTEDLVRCLWDAKEYRPDGIVTVGDLRERVLKPVEMGLPYIFPKLTEMSYGRRYGEFIVLGAGIGMGKTTLLTQQIMADLRDGHAVGAFLFEQNPEETVQRVAGQMFGKTFWIPDGSWNQDELVTAINKLEKCPPFHLYDHFGACDWDIVKERVRYLRHAHSTRIFYLDHITALAAAFEDERRGLEVMMAELGRLVKELDIWMLAVSHLATPEGRSHEEGGRVMAKHFKGSRAIMQWAHGMFALERDSQSDDESERETTTFRVLKDRKTGRSNGKTFDLAYQTSTGLLVEADAVVFDHDPPNQPDDF